MREEGRQRIGPYQRPAPPKRPLGLGASKAIQKPAISVHEIRAQEQHLLDDIKANGNVLGLTAKVRKPGRPSVYEQPMTPAERQARRRAFQSREKAIRETLKVGDAHGKSHAEAKSGGYDSSKLDTIEGLRAVEFDDTDSGEGVHRGRHVRAAEGESNAADEQTTDEILNSGESSAHRGGFEQDAGQGIRVRGLGIGDEESNRRRFTEGELRKMVEEYFASPVDKAPSANWVAKHIGNISVQHRERPSITRTCKLCGDSMEFIEDAQDHLRIDHRETIDEWFKNLLPRREFRDMEDFVTIVTPKKYRKLGGSKG
jgi:hypothetical protein